MIRNLAIVIPIYNDWASFLKLVEDIRNQSSLRALAAIHIVVINDGSTNELNKQDLAPYLSGSLRISVLDLSRNVGHQNAIATGLGWIAANLEGQEAVVVMDGDGEDRPQDIQLLLHEFERHSGDIILAQRGKRQEGFWFRCGYFFYKAIFWLLTGKRISFGNFSLLPASRLRQLCNSHEIWHSYAAGVLRSKVPIRHVRIDRGTRYFGQSKMNLVSLILHGLSAIAVFVDICTVRMLLLSGVAVSISATGIVTVLVMKMIGMASPGWASTIALLLTVISLQCILMAALILFILFIYRNLNTESPVIASDRFVSHVERFQG